MDNSGKTLRIKNADFMQGGKEMFKLPERLKTITESYRESLNEYLSGRISADRFRGIRVPFGFYSERESNVLLSRVRIPGGCATSAQLKALAYAARKFNAGIHITDRQDIQLHDVTYEDSFNVLEYLKEYELSSIGGGGNTVRNVTSCPLSGICRDEVLDCRKHAISVTEYLLEDHFATGKLPRKFKVAFSGCSTDCAYALVNDVGLIAKERDGIKGFRVYCGGGMGASSAVGQILEEFVPEEKAGYVVKAVMLTYEKHGDKFNRHRNRLRFLIRQIGFERFRELYLEVLRNTVLNEKFILRDIGFKDNFKQIKPLNLDEFESSDADFAAFLKNNVKSQKQEGCYAVELNIAQGDIAHERLEKIADLEEVFPEIEFRLTQHQNILLCNMHGAEIPDIYQRLKGIFNGTGFVINRNLMNIVACKGATTCNLGLCNSPGIARAILRELPTDGIDTASLNEFSIKISGCPNNCGQHSLGVIGLHGITRKVNLRPIPLYKVLVGGRTGEAHTRLAQELGKIPAKVVPAFMKEYFSASRDRVKNYTSVYEFLDSEGKELLKNLVDKYSYIPSYEENPDFYKDWERQEDFTLAGLGPAECGSGVLDLIEADLSDAGDNLRLAGENGYQSGHLKNALIYSVRALQVVRGLEPKDDNQAIDFFISEFVDKDIVDKKLAGVKDIYKLLQKELADDGRVLVYSFINGVYTAVAELKRQMDSHFRFPSEVKEKEPVYEVSRKVLDLKGVKCPVNYVKAKLFLETVEKDTLVTFYLDDGDPVRNVPLSLENDGYKILDKERVNGHYIVVVRK